MQKMASSAGNLHDRTGLKKVTEETPEILEYVDLSFYDWAGTKRMLAWERGNLVDGWECPTEQAH